MRRLLVALAAAAAACTTPERAPCPGVAAGTFAWEGHDPEGCRLSASPDDVLFRGTLAFEGETAWLCLDRPQATPLAGTRIGNALSVSSREEGLGVQGCACAVAIAVVVEGTLLGDDPARPAGFDGDLVERVEVAPGADPATCECTLPCEVRYGLTTAP